ncbi:hypothetical protein PHLCEN_2v8577 [Hermanssonia centrifuga]|uniref:Uncharacterized protein n=1 Tax=Hermanssonia centrifuga TaxID=98765 RepID=A0A2R6NTB8_9APHY|nr:hypothetical protein PHLCEN_2v8577 [Hermanssonia centrifuga]
MSRQELLGEAEDDIDENADMAKRFEEDNLGDGPSRRALSGLPQNGHMDSIGQYLGRGSGQTLLDSG